MNPNDIPRWLDEHGGADGPPQTDANGVTTHRAADGSFVNVFNGRVTMVGHGSQAAPAANTAPAQAAGGGMDQAALEARIAELQKQYPGLKFMGRSMKEKNRSRVDEDTGRTVTETVSVPVVEWRDPTTGYTLTAEVGPGGGAYTVTDDRIIPANKGDAERGNQPPKEEPNPADPTRMRRWNPSTNQWEDAGPNAVEIERRQKAEAERNKPQNVPTNTSEPFIVTRKPDGSLQTDKNPNYRPPAGTVKQETIKGSDGKDYVRVTVIDADNNIKIKTFGPDNREVSEIPGEGPSRPTVAGPPLPQIVLGASQDAARTYKEQLQEGVAAGRWSQAWADSRWKEFMEVANLAVSEAATRQRNEESQRNAEFNIANARMGSMNTATSNALTFVNSINGLLPAGSNLGGQAFAALLGLNMLQSQMSGMNRIDPRRQPPQLTPAEISNPAALQARREQVQTQVQQAAAPPVRDDHRTNPGQPAAPAPAPTPAPVAPAPQPLSPGQAGMMSPVPDAENPPVPAAPIEPAPPALGSAPPPAPAEAPPAAPPLTESGQRVAEQGTVILRHRVTGETRIMTRYQWQQEQERAGLLGRAANMLWEEVGGAAPDPSIPPIQGPLVEEQAPAPAPAPSGGAFPPLPVVPRAGSEAGGNVQKAMPNPAGEWAALAPMAPMPAPTQQQQQTPTGWGEPVAVRRARIAATPPWRLSEDDIAWSEQNGFGQEAWGVPGRVA